MNDNLYSKLIALFNDLNETRNLIDTIYNFKEQSNSSIDLPKYRNNKLLKKVLSNLFEKENNIYIEIENILKESK